MLVRENRKEEEKIGRKALLRIARRHKRMMARAPMLSRKICSSCISSQLLPENPDGQLQT